MVYGRRVCLLGFFLLSTACTDTAEQRTVASGPESEAVRTWLESFDTAAPSPSQTPRQAPPVSDMIDGLVAKLEQHPNDRKGWELLTRSYEFIGDHEQARVAAARAMALRADAGDSGAGVGSSSGSD